MISLFDKELIAMEREVRDLKTIHQRGLGTTRFYVYNVKIDIPTEYAIWTVTATVEDPSLLPMVAMPLIEGETTTNFYWGFVDDKLVISTLAAQGTVDVRIVTSTTFSNIETEVTPW